MTISEKRIQRRMWRIKLVDDSSSEVMGIRSQQAEILGHHTDTLQLESRAAANIYCVCGDISHARSPVG